MSFEENDICSTDFDLHFSVLLNSGILVSPHFNLHFILSFCVYAVLTLLYYDKLMLIKEQGLAG